MVYGPFRQDPSMPRSRAKATLSAIARLCGVSQPTVSGILSQGGGNNSRAGESTRRRVLDAARRLGYRPNRTALNVLHRRHGMIGVPVDNLNNVPLNVLNFLFRAARRVDCLVSFEYIGASGSEAPVFVRQDCVDGLIVFENVGEGLQEAIRRSGQPCLYVNTPIPPGRGGVQYDETQGVRLAAEHLQNRGRRRLAYVRQGEGFFNQTRWKALVRHCRRLGLPRPLLRDADTGPERERSLRGLVSAAAGVDGVLLAGSSMAADLYAAAEHAGRGVGKDLSVIGFGGGSVLHPGLTCLHIPTEAFAELIVAEMERLIAGQTPRRQLAAYELQIRESS